MSLPKHLSNVPSNRKAVAPYNFVKLPDQVVPAPPPPDHDRYYEDEDRLTGKIECTLTTASPVYIRCGLSTDDYKAFGDKSSNLDELDKLARDERHRRSDFFRNPATAYPTIPGSSIRGMLRTLVEIISFGKVERVTDSGLVYRAVGDTTSLGDSYRERLLKEEGHMTYSFLTQAGYMQETPQGWRIRPAQKSKADGTSFSRIEQSIIPSTLELSSKFPNASQVFVEIEPARNHPHRKGDLKLHYAKVKQASKEANATLQEGLLIKTGWAPRKHMEFVLNLPENNSKTEIPIPDELIQKYREQITQGQEKLLGKNGVLQHNHPVFYLVEEERLTFFGHAMMFRLPYQLSPLDFVPEELRDTSILDFAEAIFGYVRGRKQKTDQSCAGRVFISDAQTENPDSWLSTSTIKPQILGSPKPTTFQHYLVQTSTKKEDLQHYAGEPYSNSEGETKTVIRGHKLYWHKGDRTVDQLRERDLSKLIKAKKQYTEIKPVKSGVTFNFQVSFENLNTSELGAILWVLDIAQHEKYRLSLGMGKPLGMGAVKIEHQLYLSDRTQRYTTLFKNENSWETGYSNPVSSDGETNYIAAFESFILQSLGITGSFKELRCIKMLLAMLAWKENLSQAELDERRYMEIERDKDARHVIGRPKPGKNTVNEYADRPILPTPLQIMGWDDDGDDNNNPNPGSSGGGNSPKPNPRNPRGSARPKPNPRNSSSNQGGKTAMELALERAQKKPKRK
ncbi:TIGR03986 family CRISPR-associated RAMP protein [Desertifilum sp. FACHB-1129]|uniref:TIGR03986 family type III CRISPR-associated RAMP protein n=1 Tax=unclassified Desertifilum TaxID=2621682 RepID=UPI001684921A|nr:MULTISPECIES: TIGR03986 family CRISPR-associated RAMP protein [unclassified Desertifilum]MBD2311097.1 TIGR03986 family CRISPR-associated RAMP protein [Desertifilum sp. FACHB-1129]MBD2323964.1 TIGR03986 family CRISPR-associated RAMP protein [Desertifilum sp. FACHB-866]MBD2333899.1 TIGR03986 family CRISPR-associated RAMP protein [Desertifilum sp. FACHB-868]MDA0211210.1 TIGR03986 family CRISPR-associated RAMP protein [Cyanobacteria bacterium FC1]